MEISDAIRKRINELKKEKNYKDYDLFKLGGIPTSTISAFLLGKTKTIRIENLVYICEAFNVTLSEFFTSPLFDEVEAKEWKKE